MAAHSCFGHLLADATGLVGFERLLARLGEHVVFVDRRQPERRHLIVIVAGAVAVAFDHRTGAELFQTRARRDEILPEAAAVVDRTLFQDLGIVVCLTWFIRVTSNTINYHHVAVTVPHFLPAVRARRHFHRLAVESHNPSGRLAYRTTVCQNKQIVKEFDIV